jgi:heptosyltransferase II
MSTRNAAAGDALHASSGYAVAAPERLLVLAPNWLGDAVMALPVIRDLQRAWPTTEIAVAARPSVAPLYTMVSGLAEVMTLQGGGWRLSAARADAARVGGRGFDAALLLPNSFASALIAWRAGIRERWGIARDLRGPLLTRKIARPRTYGHQVEYYQAISGALGVAAGDPYASISVPEGARAAAAALLGEQGIEDAARYAVFAPGAAYGRAKQWPPEHFAELARAFNLDQVAVVLVGTTRDRAACQDVARASRAIDLSGRTDLPTLAAVLERAAHVIANDSGAMHLAAAVGAPLTAIFGPTDERKTAPLRASASAPHPRIITSDVWCRPCMLRECPIDHRCMRRVTAAQVFTSISDIRVDEATSPGVVQAIPS